jgi:hypothetical protein
MARSKNPAAHTAPFEMQFDIGTIKHLGIQMYSSLPPVIGELVSNAWDADAENVSIRVPESPVIDNSVIVIEDDGNGMSDQEVRQAYLIIGRDRRSESGMDATSKGRPIMGRKGVGKLSSFGIASIVEVETIKGGETSHFQMDLEEMKKQAGNRTLELPPLEPTGNLKKGTRVTLRQIKRYRNRSISIEQLRRGLSRRFSVIGPETKFNVVINGKPITAADRDLKRLLEKGPDGRPYLWEFDEEIESGTGWRVKGWIGALNRTSGSDDGIQRGVTLMARGKMVQEPFLFEAVVGQQFALSYLIGELHAEFVDQAEDTIATTRNSLVWDTEPNTALKKWGEAVMKRVSREWAERRANESINKVEKSAVFKKYQERTSEFQDSVTKKAADKLIREVIAKNPVADDAEHEQIVELCVDFLEFDAFKEIAEDLSSSDVRDIPKIIRLFRDWELIEAKEMMRVTEGRIQTIAKLQKLIESNALEVPTLHNFLKEFPWVLDPRWNLIADEHRYSDVLRKEFPAEAEAIETDRRIDFLCVRESTDLIVVEIKRPECKASRKELDQIEEYVIFMRDYVKRTSDPEMRSKDVVGYLLIGDTVNTPIARGKIENLADSRIYVRRYTDLLSMVQKFHQDFLKRYERLRKAAASKK